MADKRDTNFRIETPDGNEITGELPEYVLDATGQKILESILGNKETIEKLRKDQKDKNKKDEAKERTGTTAERKSQATLDKLEEFIGDIRGNVKDIKKGRDSRYKNLIGVANYALGIMQKTSIGLVGIMSGTAGAFVSLTTRLGDYNKTLLDTGVGFTDLNGSALETTAQLQRLGLSLGDTEHLLTEYSGAVQAFGKTAFADLQNQFASITNYGVDFGKTMAEASEILAEDLEIRKQLGLVQGIEANRAAQRSRELYKQQLEATTLLGKSIDEIRGASKATFDSGMTQLRMMQFTSKLGAEESANFTKALRTMQSDLSGMGLDQSVIDQIGESMFDVTAFYSEGSQNMLRSLNILGPIGEKVSGSLASLNQAIISQDSETAIRLMGEMPKNFEALAKNMNPKQMENFAYQLQFLGPFGEALAKSFNQMRIASENASKSLEIPGVQKGAARFENAMNVARGSVTSIMTSFGSAVGPAFDEFMSSMYDSAEEIDENGNVIKKSSMGVLTAVKIASASISNALTDALKITGEGASNFAERIREFIIPKILEFGTQISQWLRDGGVEKLKKFFNNTLEFFSDLVVIGSAVIPALFGLASGFAWIIEKLSGFATELVMAAIGLTLFSKVIKGLVMLKGLKSLLPNKKDKGGKGPDKDTDKDKGPKNSRWFKNLLKPKNLAISGLATNIATNVVAEKLEESGSEKSAAGVSILGDTLGWAGTGAMLGSFVPGVGTAIGAGVGAAGGTAYSLYENWDKLFANQEEITKEQAKITKIGSEKNKDDSPARRMMENNTSVNKTQPAILTQKAPPPTPEIQFDNNALANLTYQMANLQNKYSKPGDQFNKESIAPLLSKLDGIERQLKRINDNTSYT